LQCHTLLPKEPEGGCIVTVPALARVTFGGDCRRGDSDGTGGYRDPAGRV